MALAALNWRMLAPIVLPASPTMANVLDAIYTMGNASTYGDGTGRTPGTDSAWSWGRDTTNTNNVGVTTACFGTPPLNPPSGLAIKALFAGSVNAATPTMVTSPSVDTWSVNTLLMGLCKNAGAYNNANPAANLGWRDANPFTTGQFTGFVRASLNVTTQYTLPPVAYMWESQEAVIVMLSGNGGTSVCGVGALLDPMATGALNAEADGRLYCLMTSGGTSLVPSTFLGVTAAGSPTQGGGAGNAQHFYVCSLGNVTGVRNGLQSAFYYPTASMVYPSGERPLEAIPYTCNSAYSGQLRQVLWSAYGIGGQEYRYGGSTVGYAVGSSNYSAGEIIVLTR